EAVQDRVFVRHMFVEGHRLDAERLPEAPHRDGLEAVAIGEPNGRGKDPVAAEASGRGHLDKLTSYALAYSVCQGCRQSDLNGTARRRTCCGSRRSTHRTPARVRCSSECVPRRRTRSSGTWCAASLSSSV